MLLGWIRAALAKIRQTFPNAPSNFHHFPIFHNLNIWERIRRKAGLPDLKFHDLRKTFASLLAQHGVSTAVTQRLLEHSTPQLTNQVYTNVDPVLRQAINLLPVAKWL